MQYLLIHSLLALATVLPTHAFTNGTLIPAYFCNPKPDGMPKSLGQLIPFLVKEVDDLAFNTNATANLATVPVTGVKPGNAGYMLASFHNRQNIIVPINPGLGVTLASGATTLTAGVPNPLILSSLADGVALIGALIYARDANGVPVGTFTDANGIFSLFPGCGKNTEGKLNGVVHNQAITQNSTYVGLSYIPPQNAAASITLGGLSVTDNGFGVWNLTFPVTGATTTTTTTNTNLVTEIITEVLAGGIGGLTAVKGSTVRGSTRK